MYRKLQVKSFVCETDSTGKLFFRICHDFLSKNVKQSLKKIEYENFKKVRLYEENDERCLFKGLRLYLQKLQESGCENELFPLPLKNYVSRWYCTNRPLGKNTLACMMSKISQKCGTSKMYTNHCIRVSDVTILREEGHTTEEIQLVTGHKNAASVSRYTRIRSDAQMQKISNSLYKGYSGESDALQIGEIQSPTHEETNVQVGDNCDAKKMRMSPEAGPVYNFENCVVHFHLS